MSSAEPATIARTQRLAALLREHELDVLLVNEPVNLRYLTSFTGSNGLALVGVSEDAGRCFFTDFRYATQSAEQVPEIYDRQVVQLDLLEAAARRLAEQHDGGRLGFDDGALTVKQYRRLRELLPAAWEPIPAAGLVEGLRELKDAAELQRIRAAAELADEALRGVLEAGLAGRSERDVAIDLELRMRRLGASAPSFSSIVAAGPHSALPHAEAREVTIPRDTLVTIDWGALLDGYCSDCTRTFATGERLPTEDREVYELVLRAQRAGLAAVRPGPSGRAVDGVAREIIETAGHGEHFGHGLGHGVGLEVHEAPRLSRTAAEQPLRAGHVVTVEPGVYIPGRIGVRIEDLVAVTEDGHAVLNGLPKELTVVE
ncbi:MAG TPA: Xaa-Pro peptidase family protein [Solirubrobacteraceae bacterium]|jgi:Xaa-Pro aminopeptidase|nr:Xaa-Pro peptidase family protein [Solirubrobacteraceae bacterium]